MIGLVSSSSHEANVMLSLSWKCLRSSGEVKVQGAVFENGGWWWRCYSGVAGVRIICICYLEAFESKRPRNARANLGIGSKLKNGKFWCVFGDYVFLVFSGLKHAWDLWKITCVCISKMSWVLERVRGTSYRLIAMLPDFKEKWENKFQCVVQAWVGWL